MDMKDVIYRCYVPTPFWAMDPIEWGCYVSALKAEQRSVLACYPFRWAFARPADALEAADFLQDIGVDEGEVNPDAVEVQFAKLPSFSSLVRQGAVDWDIPDQDDVPPPGFRAIPEWEPMAGTLMTWPVFYPPLWETFRQIAAALTHATLFLRIPEGFLGAAVLAWLKAQGIDLKDVRPVPGPVGDIWTRDLSPPYGINRYTGEPVVLKFAFAAFYPEYRKIYRDIVAIDSRFAWTEGFKVYRTRIMYDGGYLLTDGDGTYVMTRRVLWDNATIPNLYARLEAWLGAERLIIVDEEPGDHLGHINHLKFISPKKILIGLPDDENSPKFKYLAHLHELFARCGYDVIPLPCPVGVSRTLPNGWETADGLYANSLMLNSHVLVCQYGHGLEEYDERTVEVYRKALPDHKVIPIDCSLLANGGGGINCSLHEIPDVRAA